MEKEREKIYDIIRHYCPEVSEPKKMCSAIQDYAEDFAKRNHCDEKEIFNKEGEFNLTKDLAKMLDTILIISIVNQKSDLYTINLELRRCGFFITHPELKKVVKKLTDKGLIENGRFN